MSGLASEAANCSHQFIDELPHIADELNHMTAPARRYDAHRAVLAKDEKIKESRVRAANSGGKALDFDGMPRILGGKSNCFCPTLQWTRSKGVP